MKSTIVWAVVMAVWFSLYSLVAARRGEERPAVASPRTTASETAVDQESEPPGHLR